MSKADALDFIKENNVSPGKEGEAEGYKYHLEPWHYHCFDDEEKEYAQAQPNPERAFMEEARRKSKLIMRMEGWENFYYFYPDELGSAEYGMTLFYTRKGGLLE